MRQPAWLSRQTRTFQVVPLNKNLSGNILVSQMTHELTNAANNHWGQTTLGDERSIKSVAVVPEVNLVVDDNADGSGEDAADNGQQGKIFESRRPSAVFSKGDRIRLVKEEEHTINKRQIQGQKSQDGLSSEKP